METSERPPASQRERILELGAVLLMSLAAVATAWSGYQAARWSGEQAQGYAKASATRIKSQQAATHSGQVRIDDLLYFNEAAEEMLGFAFQEGRVVPVDEWTRDIVTLDEDGSELPRHERPLSVALGQRVPTHRRIRLATPRGEVRPTEVTAFPLFSHSDICVGAMSIFWEPPETRPEAL
jgi:PAS domain-containing protein